MYTAVSADGAERPGSMPAPLIPGRPHSPGWFSRLFNLRTRSRPRERLLRFRYRGGLSFGCSPTLADIEDLIRKENLRSLVNLNMEGEPGELLSPNVEASWAHALDLRHERASFATDLPRATDVDRFLRALESVPRPVFVHSVHGRRAAAMILVHLGLERGISGAAAALEASGLGITCTHDSLRHFAESEIDRRLGDLPTPPWDGADRGECPESPLGRTSTGTIATGPLPG